MTGGEGGRIVDPPSIEDPSPLCAQCGLPLRGHWRGRPCLASPARITVDELQRQPHARGRLRAGSCHMATDGDVKELHAFAARIGVKRCWYHPSKGMPHYDLSNEERERALAAGAVFVPAREQAIARVARRRAQGRLFP